MNASPMCGHGGCVHPSGKDVYKRQIYNDTISVSKTSPIMDDDFKAALSEAFINIGNTRCV